MKRPCLLAVFMFLSMPLYANPPIKDCSVMLSFGSYASGTDHKLGKKIESYFQDNRNFGEVVRNNRGKEGEYTLCAQVLSPDFSRKAFAEIAELIKTYAGQSSPTCVHLSDVERFCNYHDK